MSEIPKDWRAVHGNTYPVKEELKALGGRFDRDTSVWWVREGRGILGSTEY